MPTPANDRTVDVCLVVRRVSGQIVGKVFAVVGFWLGMAVATAVSGGWDDEQRISRAPLLELLERRAVDRQRGTALSGGVRN